MMPLPRYRIFLNNSSYPLLNLQSFSPWPPRALRFLACAVKLMSFTSHNLFFIDKVRPYIFASKSYIAFVVEEQQVERMTCVVMPTTFSDTPAGFQSKPCHTHDTNSDTNRYK